MSKNHDSDNLSGGYFLPGTYAQSTPGAHPAYHDAGRCPLCHVPVRAPHLNSCRYTGLWLGTVADSAAGHADAHRDDDDDDGDDEWDDD